MFPSMRPMRSTATRIFSMLVAYDMRTKPAPEEPKAEPEQPAEAPAPKPTKKKKAVKPDGDK